MYRARTFYLKCKIRLYCFFKWQFPRDLEVRIKELPQFTREHHCCNLVAMWFTVEKRLFRVALHTNAKFDNFEEFPESFSRAYKRTIFRIEKEKNE